MDKRKGHLGEMALQMQYSPATHTEKQISQRESVCAQNTNVPVLRSRPHFYRKGKEKVSVVVHLDIRYNGRGGG